jgi:hypothetical protein
MFSSVTPLPVISIEGRPWMFSGPHFVYGHDFVLASFHVDVPVIVTSLAAMVIPFGPMV